MDKKLYIQPQTEILKAVFSQILAASSGVTGDTGGDHDPGYGGIDDGTHDPDIKGESWTDIWE